MLWGDVKDQIVRLLMTFRALKKLQVIIKPTFSMDFAL